MRHSSLLIIFLVVFIDLVGFGIVLPILPYYAQNYGASAWDLGWLLTTFALAQFIAAPLWGRLSDVIGRRNVLLVNLFGTAVAMTTLGLAGSLNWLFIGRLLAGICGASVPLAHAYVTDVTERKDRTRGLGMIGAAVGLGLIFGPALGGLLSRYGFAIPMFAGAVLGMMNFVFAFFRLEEPRLTSEIRSENRQRRFTFDNLSDLFSEHYARIAIILFFLVSAAFVLMESIYAFYLGARFGFDSQSCGVLLAVMGLISVAVQGEFINRALRRLGDSKVIFGACVLSALSLLSVVLCPWTALVVLFFGLFAFFQAFLNPVLNSLVTLDTPPHRRVAAVGIYHAAGNFARVITPPMAGWLYDRVSWRTPFFIAALILTGVGIVSWLTLSRRHPVREVRIYE